MDSVSYGLDLVVEGLDELFIQLGESRTDLIHRMTEDSMSWSYNSASQMKMNSMLVSNMDSLRLR